MDHILLLKYLSIWSYMYTYSWSTSSIFKWINSLPTCNQTKTKPSSNPLTMKALKTIKPGNKTEIRNQTDVMKTDIGPRLNLFFVFSLDWFMWWKRGLKSNILAYIVKNFHPIYSHSEEFLLCRSSYNSANFSIDMNGPQGA